MGENKFWGWILNYQLTRMNLPRRYLRAGFSFAGAALTSPASAMLPLVLVSVAWPATSALRRVPVLWKVEFGRKKRQLGSFGWTRREDQFRSANASQNRLWWAPPSVYCFWQNDAMSIFSLRVRLFAFVWLGFRFHGISIDTKLFHL